MSPFVAALRRAEWTSTSQVFAIGEVRLSLSLPSGMREQSASPVAEVAGVETVVRRAWHAPPAAWADLVCLRSAPTIWLPGVQQTLAEAAMSKTTARHALSDVAVDA
ncbi:MAG: hypothetical protein VB934_01800, partial [Polyangiaceae bacterium]